MEIKADVTLPYARELVFVTKVAPAVERLLVGAVQTNLVAIGKSVGKLLAKG